MCACVLNASEKHKSKHTRTRARTHTHTHKKKKKKIEQKHAWSPPELASGLHPHLHHTPGQRGRPETACGEHPLPACVCVFAVHNVDVNGSHSLFFPLCVLCVCCVCAVLSIPWTSSLWDWVHELAFAVVFACLVVCNDRTTLQRNCVWWN